MPSASSERAGRRAEPLCRCPSRAKEAAKECSNALAISPGYAKALLWRSKAYEQQGLYKQALSDVQTINKTGDASADSKATEQRLKDIMSGEARPTQRSAPLWTTTINHNHA